MLIRNFCRCSQGSCENYHLQGVAADFNRCRQWSAPIFKRSENAYCSFNTDHAHVHGFPFFSDRGNRDQATQRITRTDGRSLYNRPKC